MVSTRTKRILALSVLGIVLTGTLFAATLVVGVDRTVLDADFVNDVAEEEGVYNALVDEFANEMTAGMDDELHMIDEPTDEFVADALAEGDLEAQMATNVDRLYAYLHGDSDELELSIETVAIKDAFESNIEAELREGTTIQDELPEIGDHDVSQMTESEAAFEETREEFQEQNPAPDGFEAQVEQEMLNELESSLEDVPDETLRDELFEYGAVYVEALVYEEITYEAFTQDEKAAREEVAEAVAASFRAELDAELDDTHVLLDDDDEEVAQTLDTIQEPVSYISTLSLVLPILSLVFAGLIGWVAGSRSTALFEVGGISALVGLVTFGGVRAGETWIRDEIQTEVGEQPMIADLLGGIIDQTTAVFTTQSLALVGIGAVLVVGGGVLRAGVAPIPDVSGEPVRSAGESEATAESARPSDAADADEIVTFDEDEELVEAEGEAEAEAETEAEAGKTTLEYTGDEAAESTSKEDTSDAEPVTTDGQQLEVQQDGEPGDSSAGDDTTEDEPVSESAAREDTEDDEETAIADRDDTDDKDDT